MYAIVSCPGCHRRRIIDLRDETAACPYCSRRSNTKDLRILFKDADQSVVRNALASTDGTFEPRTERSIEEIDPMSSLEYKVENTSDLFEKMGVIAEGLTRIKGSFTVEDVDALVPGKGEKFVKALPRKSVRVHGLPMITKVGERLHPEKTRVISQLIQFKYISVAEGQKALEGFKDPSGLFQVFERTNAILVTDIQENINRMLQIVKLIDVESPVLEDVYVRTIRYAVANDIRTILEEIVTASQEEKRADSVGTNRSGSPGFSRSGPTMNQPRLLNMNNRPGVRPDRKSVV